MPDEAPPPAPQPQIIHVGSHLPLPSKLELKGNTAVNWKRFRQVWDNYEIASRLKTESKEFRTATLLTCIGQEALEIYDGLAFDDETQKKDIDVVLKKLEEFCIGTTNEIYERYLFNKRDQAEGESIDTYVAALRSLSKTCNYGTLTDNLIRDRMVVGILDKGIRMKLLQESKLTLQSCIDISRANECTKQQLQTMDHTEDVHAVDKKSSKGDPPSGKQVKQIDCKFCGKKHMWKKEECPAWGKTCAKCGGKNHFAGMCDKSPPLSRQKRKGESTSRGRRTSKVNMVEQHEASDSDDYCLWVESIDSVHDKEAPKKIFANLVLKDTPVKFQLDSGATVNILPVEIYQEIVKDPELKHLANTSTTLVMFNNSELRSLGSIKMETRNPKNNDIHLTEYTVVSKGYRALLGAQSIQQFNLMSVNVDNIMLVSDETSTCNLSSILTDYSDVFSGEGKLEQKLHLSLDKSVPPVALPVRKVPIAVKEPLKKEIDRLVSQGILEPVDTPTDWVSSMVVVVKSNGKIRLCIDPKPLNQALKRNHYPLPVIDDLLPELSKAKVFSVVDAKNGFWHIQLDTESSFLTTFGTPWGRYRWTRMPFGISPAPEEFQRRLDNALGGLKGVIPIFDDILIYGVEETKASAIADHDQQLIALLERCRSKGIKLNKEKCKFRLPEVTFMGHVISEEGLKPDPVKLQGVKEMPTPTSKQDVKRLLGMVNYLQKFAPNLSAATAPMRELLKEQNEFLWDNDIQGRSFEQVKQIISEAPVLKYFDPKADTELQCDASDKGLGACLMQEGQPVAYASRAMTDAEVNYAQIEKELLAIVFGVERFEQYVHGRPVKIETDHKPLESIFKKTLVSAPKRLQRMMLRLQKYNLTVVYKKGSEMYLADTLSRAFIQSSSNEDIMRGEVAKDTESINMVQYLPVSETTQNTIRSAMESDPVMKELKTTIREGWPETKDHLPVKIRDYFPFREELTLQNGLVFKGERLVVPASAREEMKAKIHASHIGIQGCLRRAREVLYWPGMTKEIEQHISLCAICNSHPAEQAKEPLICHSIPTRPWEKIAVDLFELDGKNFMVTVDYYSSYFEVDRLNTKTGKEVIGKLKIHLARHGIPDELVSDNGPPFSSTEFNAFSNQYGFEHVTSSPGYPQSNGKVENAVKVSKNLMRKAIESKSDPHLALLAWRNTPSEGLGTSPTQRIFGRRTKTLLPTSSRLLKPKIPEDVDQKLKLQKAKQSINYNQGARELDDLHPEDIVRLQPLGSIGKDKQWAQARVEAQVDIRSYQVRTEDGRVFRRNRKHLRRTREQLERATVHPQQEAGMNPIENTPAAPQNNAPTPPVEEQPVPKSTPAKQTPKEPGQHDLPKESKQGSGTAVIKTRSWRVVKTPSRFKD